MDQNFVYSGRREPLFREKEGSSEAKSHCESRCDGERGNRTIEFNPDRTPSGRKYSQYGCRLMMDFVC